MEPSVRESESWRRRHAGQREPRPPAGILSSPHARFVPRGDPRHRAWQRRGEIMCARRTANVGLCVASVWPAEACTVCRCLRRPCGVQVFYRVCRGCRCVSRLYLLVGSGDAC
jgi:hypothetical protein